jgi:hypothetical protein
VNVFKQHGKVIAMVAVLEGNMLRTSVFCASLLIAGMSLVQAQPPRQGSSASSRFSPELVSLLTGISDGYELNSKSVMPAMDVAAIKNAVQSKDARIQELGRTYAQVLYVLAVIQEKKVDPDIQRIATESIPNLDVACIDVLQARLTPQGLQEFKDRIKFMRQVIESGRKRGDLPEANSKDNPLEKNYVTKPFKKSLNSSALLMFGQDKALFARDTIRKMVGQPVNLISVKEPLKVKLETTAGKQVVVALTNQAKVPLHHCLVLARAFPDPLLVDKKTRMNLATVVLGSGAIGASEETTELTMCYTVIQSVINNMERGGLIFVPEIPAGGTVRLRLTALDDMPYLKNGEVSLWCNELTVESLSTGKNPGVPPILAGTAVTLNERETLVHRDELTSKDPRDSQSAPELRSKVCKVFAVPLKAGKAYTIETTPGDQTGYRTVRPPAVRIEDESGDIQETNRTSETRLTFQPKVSGTYRIICTEPSFGGPGKFVLKVTGKTAGSPPVAGGNTSGKSGNSQNSGLSTTVDGIEYTYEGTTRSGDEMFVTLVARSKKGRQRTILGQMILEDEDGKKHTGIPRSGIMSAYDLREGTPIKIVWRFGPNRITRQGSAPSASSKLFPRITVEARHSAPVSFELHDLPASPSKSNRK